MAIQLNFQCKEAWNKMASAKQGKFCAKCSLKVHDLTDKSESEIHQLYQQNNGKICGKIRSNQLKNSIYKQQKTKLAKFCLALFLVFGGYLFKTDLHAQNMNTYSNKSVITRDINYYTVNGVVLDKETNDPIFAATVYYEINKEKIGTLTDIDGKFTLEVLKTSVPTNTIDLLIRYLGYEKLKITGLDLKNSINNGIKLKLSLDQNTILMGMITTCHPIIEKDPETHGETKITGKEIRRAP